MTPPGNNQTNSKCGHSIRKLNRTLQKIQVIKQFKTINNSTGKKEEGITIKCNTRTLIEFWSKKKLENLEEVILGKSEHGWMLGNIKELLLIPLT